MNREIGFWLGGIAWLAAVIAACGAWEVYDATPGHSGPVEDKFQVSGSGWRMTIFLHPHCPCSRESVRQAALLAKDCQELSITMVVVRPAEAVPGWERGELWAEVEGLGFVPLCDEDGSFARSAGAKTSGTAVLIDPSSRIVFRGGLTSARGRGGDSVGTKAVAAWVRGMTAVEVAPVYGCPLNTSDE